MLYRLQVRKSCSVDRLRGPPSPRYPVGTVGSRGVKLTSHLHLLPSVRIRGAAPSLPHTSPCRGVCLNTGIRLHGVVINFVQGQFYLSGAFLCGG
jgi:hypothetical protein